jgi:hypothetical protein
MMGYPSRVLYDGDTDCVSGTTTSPVEKDYSIYNYESYTAPCIKPSKSKKKDTFFYDSMRKRQWRKEQFK